MPSERRSDHVGIRSWDVAGSSLTTPSAALPNDSAVDADLEYVYDASDDRVLKTARSGSDAVHTAYVFDTLELRRTTYASGDYTQSTGTGNETTESEVPYLFGHGVRLARVVYEQVNDGEPRVTSAGRQHVMFELGDHLGSTSVVLDKETSELVERGAFQAYGAKESDYRPDRWKGFREDYGFTGKEEDVEVGLTYFGRRFLSPYLGRWVSADPLGVHVPGEADLNLYAYVRGAVLKNVDPLGLQEAAANESSVAAHEHQMRMDSAAEQSVPNVTGVRTDETCTGSLCTVGALGEMVMNDDAGLHINARMQTAEGEDLAQAYAANQRQNTVTPQREAADAQAEAQVAEAERQSFDDLSPLEKWMYGFAREHGLNFRQMQTGLEMGAVVAGRGGAGKAGGPAKAGVGGAPKQGVSKIDRTAFKAEREAYWKAEAKTNPEKYSADDLTGMVQGRAPKGSDGHPMELHHVDRTPEGGVKPMTRTEHRLGENYRKNHPK